MLLEVSTLTEIPGFESEQAAAHQSPWLNKPASSLLATARNCQQLAVHLNADSFHVFFLVSHGESCRLIPATDTDAPGITQISKDLTSRGSESFALAIDEATQPLWWSSDDRIRPLTEEARHWAFEISPPSGIPHGVAFPVGLEHGRSGAIVFAGDAITVDENRLCEAHARCFSLFENVALHRAPDYAKLPSLSKRELECLRLTADGLTSDDIASALGLSVHTANQYLTNSTHKLNAVNRIHAVAKALRCGLIG